MYWFYIFVYLRNPNRRPFHFKSSEHNGKNSNPAQYWLLQPLFTISQVLSHSVAAWIACVRSLSIEPRGQELLNLPSQTWKSKLLNAATMVYACYSRRWRKATRPVSKANPKLTKWQSEHSTDGQDYRLAVHIYLTRAMYGCGFPSETRSFNDFSSKVSIQTQDFIAGCSSDTTTCIHRMLYIVWLCPGRQQQVQHQLLKDLKQWGLAQPSQERCV